MIIRGFYLLIACGLFGGCASTPRPDGSQVPALTAVSDIYSQIGMTVMLATARSAPSRQTGFECPGPSIFERRVVRIGTALAEAAYRTYPTLAERIPHFVFSVVDKAEPGVASTAGGLIVVLLPVNTLALSDEAVAFVIAREMSHVISQHHEQNTATSIAISAVVAVVAPALNVARLFAFLASSSGSALAATSVTSAASFAGSRVVIESYGERQRRVADDVAAQLLAKTTYNVTAVPDGFAPECTRELPTRWVRELQESVARITRIAQIAPPAVQPPTPAVAPTPPAPVTAEAGVPAGNTP